MRGHKLIGAQVTHVIYADGLGVGRIRAVHPRNPHYVVVRWMNSWTYIELIDHLRLAGYQDEEAVFLRRPQEGRAVTSNGPGTAWLSFERREK